MSNFKRLATYLTPHRKHLIIILVLGIIVSSIQPGSVLLIKPVLDDVFARKDMFLLKMLPIGLVIFYVIGGVARYFYDLLIVTVSQKVIFRIQNEVYQRLQDLSIDFYTKSSTGYLMTRTSQDVQLIGEAVSKLESLIKEPLTFLGLLCVAFYRDWKLTLITLIFAPVIVFLIAKVGHLVRRYTHKRQDQLGVMNSLLQETFTGVRVIRAFGLEKVLNEKFFRETQRLYNIILKAMRVEIASSPALEFVGSLGIAFLVAYGGYRVVQGDLTTGEIVSVVMAMGLLINPIKRMNHLNHSLQKSFAGAERVFALLDLSTSVPEAAGIREELKEFNREIRFENVSFRYEKDWVLKGVSFAMQKGEVIALVGSSGGGKTTLVNLLPRFYDVSGGGIFIDDMDIRRFSLASLRKKMALVSQEIFLFNDTVGRNMAYGDLTQSNEAIRTAAKAAQAHDFIMELPQKYDTIIGERGVKLSGGQRQRISIARALLKNAPILILDEATSALDSEAEILVQKAIERLMQNRTTLVIAHRLSTIQGADRIIVIDNGEIREIGKHQELVQKRGEYFRFYQLQNDPVLRESLGRLEKD